MATTVHAAVHTRSKAPRRDFSPPIKGWHLRPRRRRVRRRARYVRPLPTPALDSAHTKRASESCQVRLCGGHRRERSNAADTEKERRQYWLTYNREDERPTARRRFSTLTSTAAWAGPFVVVLERRALPSAAADTTFNVDS